MILARCPLCGRKHRTYHDPRFSRLHFEHHVVPLTVPLEPCPGSGWLVEPDDIEAAG